MALLRETGASSLPVVTVVNLLIGAVLGFVGAVQLAAFGAGLYLADLVGIAVAREMAAIMTAFIMAGRIGATFAAHLATMEANEEIDALRMIGVSPFEFLVLPRLTALTLMMPLLFLYAAALGIGGGMIVADLVLDTSPASFLGRLQDAVAARHFVIGFVKAVCFGILIALASCYLGMRAGRNAAEVGRAATRTVVVSIIGIIVIDAIFALCTNALGV
nr:ABC transporter permease [Endozoicomonas sp. G2_2]